MEIKAKRFLIVGGASLAGSHIADALLAAGAGKVRILDNYSLGVPSAVAHLASDDRVEMVKGDMLRLNELMDASQGIDGIFLVAAYLAGPIAANPRVGVEVNTLGVLNVLEAARFSGVKRIVHSSSVGLYGNAVELDSINEDTPMITKGMGSVMTIYSASKLLGEGLFRLYNEKYGMEYVALRYSSIYGPRQHTHSINALPVVTVYESLKKNERPVIFGDGNEVHDYLFVGDLAQANVKAMASDVKAAAVTIASGKARSINDIARTLIAITGSKLEPEYREATGKLKFTDSTKLNYDVSRAKEVIGWSPDHTLEQGIQVYVDWRRQQDQAE